LSIYIHEAVWINRHTYFPNVCVNSSIFEPDKTNHDGLALPFYYRVVRYVVEIELYLFLNKCGYLMPNNRSYKRVTELGKLFSAPWNTHNLNCLTKYIAQTKSSKLGIGTSRRKISADPYQT